MGWEGVDKQLQITKIKTRLSEKKGQRYRNTMVPTQSANSSSSSSCWVGSKQLHLPADRGKGKARL